MQRLGRPEFDDGFVGPSLLREGDGEIVVRHIVPLGDTQGIAPESFVVAPIAELVIGETSENEDHEKGSSGRAITSEAATRALGSLTAPRVHTMPQTSR